MAAPTPIAVEELSGPPQCSGASISPDGTKLAYLAPWKNRLNVWVGDLDGQTEPRCVTADETRSVLSYLWTDDPRWLLYQQDDGGDENWHLYRVDLSDPDAGAVNLTPFPGARALGVEPSIGAPGKVTLLLNARDVAEFDLHELDIATGELVLLGESRGPGKSWMRAGGGQLLSSAITEDGDIEISRRDADTGEWHRVVFFEGADYPLGALSQLTPDGTGMWIGSHDGSDLARLVHVDLMTGDQTEIDAHPTCDLDTRALVTVAPSPFIRDRRGELRGVRYLEQRQVIHPLDAHFAAVLRDLRELSDGDLAEISCDDSAQRWVVSFTHDRDPGVTWFYDHATGHSRLLFRPYPHLDPERMAPMRPVTIPARDGLALPSYLTLPVSVEPTNLPLVLIVHGGPWARDSWGHQKPVQLLANRGYAVLQVNFRGSTGFGKAHTRAAIGGVRRGDARRPDRRGRLGRGPGIRRPRTGRDLRWLLRRVRRVGGGDIHSGSFRRRRGLRGYLEPGQLHANPTLVRQTRASQQLVPLRRRSRFDRAGSRHAGPFPDHPNRPHPHPADGDPGGQ